jgi:hypothetical protein
MAVKPDVPKVSINTNDLQDRVCACGCPLFFHVLRLKEVPAMLSQSGKTETAMMPVGFACIMCGAQIPLRPEQVAPMADVLKVSGK